MYNNYNNNNKYNNNNNNNNNNNKEVSRYKFLFQCCFVFSIVNENCSGRNINAN